MKNAALGPIAEACERRLEALECSGFTRRLAQRDAGLWKPGDAAHARVIAERLGWLDSPGWMAERLDAVEGLAAELRGEGFRKAILLGMGGSSLCPEVLRRTFGVAEGAIDVEVLDSTHPDAVRAAEAGADPARTVFIVASKSGGTAEVKAFYAYFRGRIDDGGRFIAITDPDSPLAGLAARQGFRRTFLNAPDVGGRYSALSYFGMVPAVLLGLDAGALLARSQAMAEACGPEAPALANPGLELGIVMAEAALAGRDKLSLVLPPGLASFGGWVEQLVAESTGKEGKGVLPVDGEVLGDPAVYGADRFFVAVRDVSGKGKDEDAEARLDALAAAGHPVYRIEVQGRLDLGAELFRWEYATAACGAILGVDPFDEPNVREAKELTAKALNRYAAGQEPMSVGTPQGGVPEARRDSLPGLPTTSPVSFRAMLDGAKPGDYLALLAYLPRSDRAESELRALANAVRDKTRLAVTVGYGPRYLHSTGQYHKGGPGKGLFVLFRHEAGQDLPIPGEPYGFAGLCGAQAQGDLGALRAHDRPVVQVPLAGEPAQALKSWRQLEGF